MNNTKSEITSIAFLQGLVCLLVALCNLKNSFNQLMNDGVRTACLIFLDKTISILVFNEIIEEIVSNIITSKQNTSALV